MGVGWDVSYKIRYVRRLIVSEIEYTREELEHRIDTIEQIVDEHFDDLNIQLGTEFGKDTKKTIISIIQKTIQLYEHRMKLSVKVLEESYEKLPQSMRDGLNIYEDWCTKK